LENEEQKMIFIFSGDINHSGAVAGHLKVVAPPPELAFFTLFLKKKKKLKPLLEILFLHRV